MAAGLAEPQDDYRTWTIRIRPGIFFADHPAFGGRPRELTAADFVFWLKRFVDPTVRSSRVSLTRGREHAGTCLAHKPCIRMPRPLPLHECLVHRSPAMPNVSEVMSTNPQVVQPQDSLRRAAELMRLLDVGALPVCDGERLVGMVTDRDITVRGVACGLAPEEARVSDIMSPDLVFCTGEQDTEEAMRVMGEKQVRRLPVVDVDKRLVGIVALADLALRQSGHIDKAVREISQPEEGALPPGQGAGTSPRDAAPH